MNSCPHHIALPVQLRAQRIQSLMKKAGDGVFEMIGWLSKWLLPALIAFIPVYGLAKRVPVYESFVDGAKESVPTITSIFPHLLGMMVGIHVFRESGAMDVIIHAFVPLLSWVNFPEEVVPLAFMRPISGAGSLAMASDIIQTYGADSFLGRLASTMQGSTDTTLYVLTVYFGAVGIRNSRYALKVGLLADAVGLTAAWLIASIVFPS